MPRKAPQMVTGLRGVKDEPVTGPAVSQSLPDPAAALSAHLEMIREAEAASKPADGDTFVFHSRFANMRIQLTAPADKYDVATGILVRGVPQVAQFDQGVYRTKDAEKVSRLMESSSFRLGDVWLASERAREVAVAAKESLLATLSQYPDLIQSVREALEPVADVGQFDPKAKE